VGVAAIFAMWLLSAVRAYPETVIALKDAVEVTSERIELRALATVTGPEQERKALESVDVGPTPLPGRSRTLTLGYLKMRMRRWGLDPESVAFAGSQQIEVSRPAAPVQPIDLRADEHPSDSVTSLAPPVTVKRGCRVQLTVVCGGVHVVAEAMTLEDGVVGQPVKIRVAQTRETVWGTLYGPTSAILRL